MAATSRSPAFTYDVFLSFRGQDTRHHFTGNLYKALDNRGIYTFIDDKGLRSGEEITPTLVKAIEESRIAIVVFSEDYASSSFCLDELATILHCAKKKDLLAIPVFCKVDPSDVRHQKGSYGKALAKHEKRFKAKKERLNHNMERLKKWKTALHQVANLSGYHYQHGREYEHEFIERIVKRVSEEINRVPLHVADYPVGLGSQLQQVRKLLDVGSDDVVHMIGIHGMGGVGKTTLALAVYNLIAGHFDGSCFLQNVREKSNKDGLEHLQSILLSKILGKKDTNLTSWQEGMSTIRHRLQRKKVLLILDDVDKHKQLEAFAGRPDWFGPGSRVIITTRDKQLLDFHEVKRTHEVKELNENDAVQLLTWKAFKTEQVDPSYAKVLNRVVAYASGLPLALEVIGSNLFRKSIQEWESAIQQYRRIPKHEIVEILKVSFDALEKEEKSVFLDIACFFKGHELTEVERILGALYYNNSMKHHIAVLVEKSLIKISWHGRVEMHDLIQDMGRQIDQQESPEEPGKRRRLWLPNDIIQVLKDKKGTSKNEMICLDFYISDKEETVEWDGNAFKEMENLKILIIRNGKFSEGPNYFPQSLRVLEWHGYPSNCLPSNFQPNNLAICKLPDSCFTSFELDGLSKKLENVTVLKFDECKFLTQIPDVSDLPNLVELSFKGCKDLNTVHESVGILPKLKILNAQSCSMLRSFPALNLTSLETLELSFCSSLENFPEISGKMENISELLLSGLPIEELPLSFENLIGLEDLSLVRCGNVRLRSSIATMLQCFSAYRCKGLQWVKSEEDEEKVGSIVSSEANMLWASCCNLNNDFFSIGFTLFAHVSSLCLDGNSFTILPECLEELQFLDGLDVSDCKYLREIRGVPPNLKYLKARNCISLTSSSSRMFLNQELHQAGKTRFHFTGESIPEWFDQQSRGPSSSFWFRNKFPHNVLCLLIAPVFMQFAFITPKVFINGKVQEYRCQAPDKKRVQMLELDHTQLSNLQMIAFDNDLFEVPIEKEWNHVEVTYAGVVETSIVKASGIHVFKEESDMDNIRFTDPCGKRKLDDDLNSLESQNHSLLKSIGIWTRKKFRFGL